MGRMCTASRNGQPACRQEKGRCMHAPACMAFSLSLPPSPSLSVRRVLKRQKYTTHGWISFFLSPMHPSWTDPCIALITPTHLSCESRKKRQMVGWQTSEWRVGNSLTVIPYHTHLVHSRPARHYLSPQPQPPTHVRVPHALPCLTVAATR